MKRSVALGAVVLALGAGGTALGQISPAVIEVHNAPSGPLGSILVANRSTIPLSVTVTPRPWLQSDAGKVSPNRKAKLAGLSLSESAFTLAPGAEKQVAATLNGQPAN